MQPFFQIISCAILILYGTTIVGDAAEEKHISTMVVAGGCFWCIEADFDRVEGVISTTSGYTGGHVGNPTYKNVTAGGSGHFEAVSIKFDSAKVSYTQLLKVFWRVIDPTDIDGQFCDRGKSYRTAIFTNTPEQNRLAKNSKEKLGKAGILKSPIVTIIKKLDTFYRAEEYHQDYYKKNPFRYSIYRFNCGRDRRIKELWGGEFQINTENR